MEAADSRSAKTVLFVCTGNVYRSRYAEAYFNHRAREEGLSARAVSRGLRVELVDVDISSFTVEALAKRGISRTMTGPTRRALTLPDLQGAHVVVALRELEHRPIMAERFPEWAARLRYWDVADTPEWSTQRMVETVERNTEALLEELRGA